MPRGLINPCSVFFLLHRTYINFFRGKTRLAIKDAVEATDREVGIKQKKAAIHHAGANYEQQQLKLDRTVQSKEEAIRTKQVQGSVSAMCAGVCVWLF